jgi:hypothetical protein
MKTSLCFGVFALTVLLSCPSVYADALPPEAMDCWAKKVGEACTDLASKQAGSCEEGTCTSRKLDAGATTYSCLTCSGAPPTADDGACTIAKQSTARRLGPWLLAGAVSVLFLLGRRRRRRS